MKNTTTIADIGQLFADNGYINSSYGIAHYNTDNKSFEYVSDVEVMDIFTRIYPNFERKPLSIDMIKKHLPSIPETEFHTYHLCKKVENSNYEEQDLKRSIKKLVNSNNVRKTDIPAKFPGNDYDTCIKFLINNDIFRDGSVLYHYKDGDFEPFGFFEIKKLMKNHLTNKIEDTDYFKILYMAQVELTDISSIQEALEIRHLINDVLNQECWQTYERIVNIEVKTMKTQGVYENEYPLSME